jgi:hypothetical protein
MSGRQDIQWRLPMSSSSHDDLYFMENPDICGFLFGIPPIKQPEPVVRRDMHCRVVLPTTQTSLDGNQHGARFYTVNPLRLCLLI